MFIWWGFRDFFFPVFIFSHFNYTFNVFTAWRTPWGTTDNFLSFASDTKTREQTIRFDPRTRDFQLILSFSRKQGGGENVRVQCWSSAYWELLLYIYYISILFAILQLWRAWNIALMLLKAIWIKSTNVLLHHMNSANIRKYIFWNWRKPSCLLSIVTSKWYISPVLLSIFITPPTSLSQWRRTIDVTWRHTLSPRYTKRQKSVTGI